MLTKEWGDMVDKMVFSTSLTLTEELLKEEHQLIQVCIDWDLETQGREHFPIQDLYQRMVLCATNASLNWFFYGWELYRYLEENQLSPNTSVLESFAGRLERQNAVDETARKWLAKDKYLAPLFFRQAGQIHQKMIDVLRKEQDAEFNYETIQKLAHRTIAASSVESFDLGGRTWRAYSDAQKIALT
jgi:hypothetical protein